MNNYQKQYLKLISACSLRMIVNFAIPIWFFLFAGRLISQVVNGIKISGTIQTEKNLFYQKALQGSFTETHLVSLFSVMVAFFFCAFLAYYFVKGEVLGFSKRMINVVLVTIVFLIMMYVNVNQTVSPEMSQALLQGILLPEAFYICIDQLTTVQIERIKQQIVEESRLFELPVQKLPTEYKGLSKNWQKYLIVEEIKVSDTYELAYPFRNGIINNFGKIPDILGINVQKTVITRLKNTWFHLEFLSGTPIYKEFSDACRAKAVDD